MTGLASAATAEPHRTRDPLDDCVHCGFCLSGCPTYQAWGEEMDSPRGRIDLMRGLREGRVELGPVVLEHFDRCLGCMACLTTCPSGVRYDVLIERTRAELEARGVRRPGDRLHRALLFALFPHPARLRALVPLLWVWQKTGLDRLARRLGLLRLVPRRLAQLDALAPDVQLGAAFRRLPAATRPAGPPRLRVALVEGCVQRVFFSQVNAATLRVLAAEGCEVLVPRGQGCCGALSVHAGREEEARRFARALIERLEAARADVVVVNAAGCGSHLKELGRLLAGDPAFAGRAAALAAKVRDVSEVLSALPAAAPRHPLALRVAYQPACHLAHAQRLREGPVALLRAIPGLELFELSDGCCGSAGIYNLVEPEAAAEIGARKVDAVAPIHPDVVAAGNPGCLLQLRAEMGKRGLAVRVAHPVELIDASIRGEP